MASKKAERLKAGAANPMLKFFSAADEENAQEADTVQTEKPQEMTVTVEEKPVPGRTLIISPTEEKPVKTANTKPQKQVFSFRAEKELVKQWRTYAAACPGMKVDELGRLALQEYIENHPLTGAAKKFYQESMKEG